MIKAVPPARSNGLPNVFPTAARFSLGFYDSCRPLTTRGIWRQRGVGPRLASIIAQNATLWVKNPAWIGPTIMPQPDFRDPRLFVDAALAPGETVALERSQSNYLGNVLRLSAGGTILVFNGRDGEWQAAITGRKRPDGLNIVARTRPQDRLPDLTYVFAPLKHARLDYMVQKAVEMGASSLQPVLTRFTQVSRVNSERMRANVIEAAEQCGILSIATVADPIPLDRYLSQRETARLLVFCDEAADVRSPLQALPSDAVASNGIDVLIGPEGGFAEEERNMLVRQ